MDGQIRVARTKTAAGRRWVAVPDELLDALDAITAIEDRDPNGRVLGLAHDQIRRDLAKACTDAASAVTIPMTCGIVVSAFGYGTASTP